MLDSYNIIVSTHISYFTFAFLNDAGLLIDLAPSELTGLVEKKNVPLCGHKTETNRNVFLALRYRARSIIYK